MPWGGAFFMSNLFVVGMGIGTVFLGLVCIVLLCLIMSAICRAAERKPENSAAPAVAPAVSAQPIENRQEIIAAVSAALAEEMGTDISAIRIHSFKKI